MDSRAIPHDQLPHTTRLFRDYLYDFSRVSEFYEHAPFDRNSYRKAAATVRYANETRQAVAAVLKEQNQAFGVSPEALRNLQRLAKPGCYAVVTGQQVGLFTGPAFSLYKALTAIRLAKDLTSNGIEAVPVFWLATEDHDWAEVNHCYLQDREGGPHRIQYLETPAIPNSSVGPVELGRSIAPLLDSVAEIFPDTEQVAELLGLLRDSYGPGATLGSAFGTLMSRLFAEHGVVMLDPLDTRLHRLTAPVFRAAIEAAPQIVSDLLERNRRLLEGGYHAQVHVADNTFLLFLYQDGQRTPLRLEGKQIRSSSGDAFSLSDLLRIAEENPERLSPNVLLRPVMQDALLPTVAYVGGPAELAYMAQAAPVYQRLLGREPVFFPRASFSVVDAATDRLLNKYELPFAEICGGKQTLRERMALRYLPSDLTSLFERSTAHLAEDLDAVQASLAKLDPTLVDAAKNSAQKMQYQLSNLQRKAASAVQHRTDLVDRDAMRLENMLCPDRTPQERFYGGVSLLARYDRGLLEQLYKEISLESPDHRLVIAESTTIPARQMEAKMPGAGLP